MASILIVDDDKAVQIVTKLMLEREGHSVTCASTGPRALHIVRHMDFDLFIIDVVMPEMDGLETMKLAHLCRPEVPIIVISSHTVSSAAAPAPDFPAMSIRRGAVSSLHKPFKSAVLLSHVDRCLMQGNGSSRLH
ncbi:response regulator [Tardiphaga sp.]|uniref:response regulator n=1 Tax=Tardiphaga sp. TaxID=1926292 RepID=UPI00352B808B